MKSNIKQSVALSSVFASGFLTFGKLIVGLLTGSIGIISEALHSALDFLAATLTFFAVRVGDQPADKEHPFGHLKIESISALIETGLLFLTSFWIIYEAIQRLLFKTVEVKVTWYAIAIVVISIIIDFSRSRALDKVAKETKSQALEADALHFSSDIYSSFVVLAGLIFVSFGFNKGDAIAAIGVSLFVLFAGFQLGKRTIDVLVDAAPEGITDHVVEAAKKVKEVLNIERIRVRPTGAFVYIDMIVDVSRKLSLEKTQSVHQKIEKEIHKIIPEADLTIQVRPLPLKDETIIERVQITALNHNLSVHDIVVHTQNNKKYLSFDLEIESSLSIKKAHDISCHLEKSLKDEIGEDIVINTHIEPLRPDIILGKNIPVSEEAKINEIINKIIKSFSEVKDLHKVQIRKAENKLFISLHCRLDDNTKLEEVHDLSTDLEYLITKEIKDIQRIVIHTEPMSL